MGAAKIGQAHKQSGACARIHVRIGIVKQQTDAVSGVSGCASAPAHGDVSWRAKAGRAGKRGARFAAQLALVVAVYGAGCAIASVLPVRLPGNIVGMVLLLVLLGTGLLKARHVGDACDCLLDNMSLFFIPAGVAIRDGINGASAKMSKSPEGGSLFDLEKDPKELDNVASQHPDICEQMKAKLEEIRQRPATKADQEDLLPLDD